VKGVRSGPLVDNPGQEPPESPARPCAAQVKVGQGVGRRCSPLLLTQLFPGARDLAVHRLPPAFTDAPVPPIGRPRISSEGPRTLVGPRGKKAAAALGYQL
jgi:hypothetical protein